MSDIRVALVGCGGMGKGLVSQLKTIDGGVLVAGVDPSEGSRETFTKEMEVPAFPSFEELLASVEVDAVVVANPNSFHAPATIAAAQAGKHVFCEKPMSLSMADCRAMIGACKSAGVKLQIGQVLRYISPFYKAVEMAQAGDLGQPMHGTIFRYGPPKADWGQTWRDDPVQVGHFIFEVAVHEIDFARCIFGTPVAVTGWDRSLDPSSPLWAKATTWTIEFESGAICTLTEGMFNPFSRAEAIIAGTEGAVQFQWSGGFSFKSLTGKEDFELTGAEVAEGVENGVHREVREWIEAIGNDTPVTIPGEDGMANIEIALAALASSERKERVALPL